MAEKMEGVVKAPHRASNGQTYWRVVGNWKLGHDNLPALSLHVLPGPGWTGWLNCFPKDESARARKDTYDDDIPF